MCCRPLRHHPGSIDVECAPKSSQAFPCRVPSRLRQYEIPCAAQLDAKMPKATNALHGDQISAAQASVAKSVVCCNTSAEERAAFYGVSSSGTEEMPRASAIITSAYPPSTVLRYDGVLTLHHVSASAWFAHAVFTAGRSRTDPLTDFHLDTPLPKVQYATTSCPERAEFQTRIGCR